ncbi:hypothetical protein E2C01_080280 [Portunus trituberculatus]|uniref:Uncharacterized protein n=1 Tax=Portunus trituberculatus TaxID=210409 RepID=A0A5B7IJ96_PORTR|nr:hypothetical protein [Portunus trituberculatus]
MNHHHHHHWTHRTNPHHHSPPRLPDYNTTSPSITTSTFNTPATSLPQSFTTTRASQHTWK